MTMYHGNPRIDEEVMLEKHLKILRERGLGSGDIYVLRITGATDVIGAGAAITALNYNNTFDGTAVPVEVDVISDGADTRVITILGIDENDDLVEEEVTLTGAVAVTTTTKWKRLIHASAISDAARTWNIEDVGGGGSDYFTVAPTSLEAYALQVDMLDGYDNLRCWIDQWHVEGAPLAGGTGFYISGIAYVDSNTDISWQATTLQITGRAQQMTNPAADNILIHQTDGMGATAAYIDVVFLWTDE